MESNMNPFTISTRFSNNGTTSQSYVRSLIIELATDNTLLRGSQALVREGVLLTKPIDLGTTSGSAKRKRFVNQLTNCSRLSMLETGSLGRRRRNFGRQSSEADHYDSKGLQPQVEVANNKCV